MANRNCSSASDSDSDTGDVSFKGHFSSKRNNGAENIRSSKEKGEELSKLMIKSLEKDDISDDPSDFEDDLKEELREARHKQGIFTSASEDSEDDNEGEKR